jgi:hypothetical protein
MTGRYALPAGESWESVDTFDLRNVRTSVSIELEPRRWNCLVRLLSQALADNGEIADASKGRAELRAILRHIETQLDETERRTDSRSLHSDPHTCHKH